MGMPGSTLKRFATGFAALSRRATAPLQRAIVGSGPTALPSLSAHVLASNSSTSLGATAAPRWPTLHDPECLGRDWFFAASPRNQSVLCLRSPLLQVGAVPDL